MGLFREKKLSGFIQGEEAEQVGSGTGEESNTKLRQKVQKDQGEN